MNRRVAITCTALLAVTCFKPNEVYARDNTGAIAAIVGLGILGGAIAGAQQQQYYRQQQLLQQQLLQQRLLRQQYQTQQPQQYHPQQFGAAWSQVDPRVLECIRNSFRLDPVLSGYAPSEPLISSAMSYCYSLIQQASAPVSNGTVAGSGPVSLAPEAARPPVAGSRQRTGTDGSIKQQDVVPIAHAGANFTVNATVNGSVTVRFLVDSGAEIVAIPINLFKVLRQRGAIIESDILDTTNLGNADGSTIKTLRFVIRELQVGRHIAHNVEAVLLPSGSDALLGQTFLGQFTWTLDARNQQLIITD